MSLRRLAPLALVALAVLGCQPSISNQAPPATVAYAVSFPDASDGTQSFLPPQPNDLILQSITAAASAPSSMSAAQFALLNAFAAGGGWPNDQELPIQIQFYALTTDPNGGSPTPAAFPTIDVATLTSSTVAIVRLDGGTPTAVDFDVAGYNAGTGVLTLRKKADASGSRAWPTGAGGGRYVVALRGGASGVKTTDGQPIAAQVSALLVAQDKDLTAPENQGLLATTGDAAAAGAKLEQIRQLFAHPVAWTYAQPQGAPKKLWVPGPAPSGLPAALAAIDTVFPHRELASLQTFVVDPHPHVALDPTAGVAPLPSEFLMDPATYYVDPLASKVKAPAVGALAPLAAGLNTLDGFGTTPALLAPTSGTLVKASTVTGASVLLLEKQGATWARVKDFNAGQLDGVYLSQPPPATIDTATGHACAQPYPATCAAAGAIALAPAVTVPLPNGAIVPLPPLKDHTLYAVLFTSDVTDLAGAPLAPSTLGKMVAIAANPQTPVVDNQGHSQLSGVTDAQAQQIQGLAALVIPEQTAIVTAAATSGYLDPTKFVTGYTFPTQTIRATATQLAAIPGTSGQLGVFAAATPITTAAAAAKYGVPAPALTGVASFVEATLVTADLLDPGDPNDPTHVGGAFKNPPVPSGSLIPALIALPTAQAVNTYAGGAAPLVVFRHGINRGRADMMLIAGALAGHGMVVAAIDAAKFGDRAWCAADTDCASGQTCDLSVFGNQGDPAGATPGLCGGTGGPGKLAYNPVVGAGCTAQNGCTWDGTGGIAAASGRFYVSANLFRLRDTMRQDIIDEVALVKALKAQAGGFGVAVDTSRVFYVSQSLGSINGAADLVASGDLFTRAVLNVGGGTFVDIAENSPAFEATLNDLVTSLGITPGTLAYEEFLQVAKWVIDPADPINFVQGLQGKSILGQAARCDSVVPNGQNELFYGLMGLQPLNPLAQADSPGLAWYMANTTDACPADGSTGSGGAAHGFLLDISNAAMAQKAQTDVVTFLLTGAAPASTPVTP